MEPNLRSNLSGVYRQINKGSADFGCEGIVSYFDIQWSERDSSFLYHTFCHPHDFDPVGQNFPFKGCSVYGTCTKIDSNLIQLIAYSGEILRMRINSDKTIDLYHERGNPTNPGIYFYDTYLKAIGRK